MDQEMDRLVQAILIASDPTQATVHQQALEYISTVQQNAATTWRMALPLFVDSDSQGARKYPASVRFFALRVLDEFLDNRLQPLDQECFDTIRQALMNYAQSEYVYGTAEANASFLRNKFSHTLTLFFLATYIDQWPAFFNDLFMLIRPVESSSQSTFNRHVSLLFFHIVLEISGEVYDVTLKSARQADPARHARDGRVRDMVRERDAAQINEAVLTIVAEGSERMANLRKMGPSADTTRELGDVVEIVDLGIRTYSSYVGWIDINLTVTPTTVQLLFTSLGDPSLPIRLAASSALMKIVSKGLKEPGDKLQLIKVLSLGEVVDALEVKTRQEQAARGKDADEGEESYREALGKLLNALGLELMKLIEEPGSIEVDLEAKRMLEQILPVLLRFLSDEYDDTCNTVFPLLHEVLTNYKRARKTSTSPLDGKQQSFLESLLKVLLEKMKWDEDTDLDDPDEDDQAAFEDMRKDLRVFMDSISSIDLGLVTNSVQMLSTSTLTAYRNGASVEWNDAELAIYLVYIFGEINKSGGKGRAAFVQGSAADLRKQNDLSEYPLTIHGALLLALVSSGISSYPNKVVVMQFHEAVTRYGDFFKIRKDCIVPTLEAMIDTRGLHNSDSNIRSRVFYLFYRFMRDCRNEVLPEVAVSVLEGIRDLLVIQVELPELEDAGQDLLAEAVKNPGIFEYQLYLYETAGVLCSALAKDPNQQASLLLSLVKPLMDDLSANLQIFTEGSREALPILKVHHTIMALGNIAKGFPDYPNPIPDGFSPPPLEVFNQVAQALLVCLEAMNVLKPIREATRFAFARILATTGTSVTHLIPALMSTLLAHFEPSELVEFLNFISLLIHKLQQSMFPVLDELIGPLGAHIMSILSQPVLGTDDQLVHSDTKKAYIGLLNSIVVGRLQGVLTSDRNSSNFQSLMETMVRLVEDISDTATQKAAIMFLSRCITTWGQLGPATPSSEQDSSCASLPGFERFIYERIVPGAFSVPSSANLNPKDAQTVTVLHEIATLLQHICKTRGQEAYNYLAEIYFPSQNWPAATIHEFMTKLRGLDSKGFRKYFTDFVRSSRS